MASHIEVPMPLLLSTRLTPSAKLLWIVFRHDARARCLRSHGVTDLSRFTGLVRSTIYEALRRLTADDWCEKVFDESTGQSRWRVRLPAEKHEKTAVPAKIMLHLPNLRPRQVLAYALLRKISRSNRIVRFKWAGLRALCKWHIRTWKRAVLALAETSWAKLLARKRRIDPIRCRLGDADEAWKWAAQQRLEKADFKGERLMREWLILIVRSAGIDEAAPDFLRNPETGELLRLDRAYLEKGIAFEFNGPQHYRATEKYGKETVAAQRRRDAFKRQACKRQNIKLIVVHAEDLSLEGMLSKVGDTLPLRDLRGFQETIDYLEACSRRYREAARH